MDMNSYEFWQAGKLLKVWQHPSAEGWRCLNPGHLVILHDESVKTHRVVAVVHVRHPANAVILEVQDA